MEASGRVAMKYNESSVKNLVVFGISMVSLIAIGVYMYDVYNNIISAMQKT